MEQIEANIPDDLETKIIAEQKLGKTVSYISMDGIAVGFVSISDKIKPTILSNGSSGFISKSEINQLIARPLTASMVKMHRACQDNYYSDNFLNSKNNFLCI